jgi:hypothetical protein
MIKRTSVVILVCTLALAAMLSAQNPPPMPTPAPELKNLNYFVGKWKLEGDMKPGPMGPGGKWTGTEQNEWMEGSFFVVSHSEFKGNMGNGKGIAFMGYDSDKKVYTYHEFNSMGESVASEGTLEGDTWTWNSQERMGGATLNTRFIIKQVSPTSFTVKFDMGPAGGEMANVMEGKATKQ